MYHWQLISFDHLSSETLYNILALRSEVFVVEQNCVYQDVDGKDLQAYHLCCFKDKELVAYARLLPPGLFYKEASIGRVLSKTTERRTGIGRELMKLAISHTKKLFPGSQIRIGAQYYLKNFYESFDFQQVTEPYLEDGIPHIEMILTKI